MKFGFPLQIFLSKYRYSQGNVQVRRGLGNYQDDRYMYIENIKQAPPGLPVVCCFVPLETRLLLFVNSSPITPKDWTTAYFEQFKVWG